MKDVRQTIYSAIYISIVSWSAVVLLVLILLGYRNCQNTDDRVIECIKVGRSPAECRAALVIGGTR